MFTDQIVKKTFHFSWPLCDIMIQADKFSTRASNFCVGTAEVKLPLISNSISDWAHSATCPSLLPTLFSPSFPVGKRVQFLTDPGWILGIHFLLVLKIFFLFFTTRDIYIYICIWLNVLASWQPVRGESTWNFNSHGTAFHNLKF